MSAMSLMSASAMGDSAFSVDCVVRGGTVRPVQMWGVVTVLAPPALVGGSAVLWRCFRRPQHVAVTALIILILAHPTLCKGAFSLLSCRVIGGRLFLEADMNVSCASNEYIAWGIGLGIPSLVAERVTPWSVFTYFSR